jgi:hypothetical protein
VPKYTVAVIVEVYTHAAPVPKLEDDVVKMESRVQERVVLNVVVLIATFKLVPQLENNTYDPLFVVK